MSDTVNIYSGDLEKFKEIAVTRGLDAALAEVMRARGVLISAVQKAWIAEGVPLDVKVALGGALQEARLR